MEQMFQPNDRHRIDVVRSSGSFLRAVVVSDSFAGQDAASRQELTWRHLGTRHSKELLNRLFGVHPYTWREFLDEVPQS